MSASCIDMQNAGRNFGCSLAIWAISSACALLLWIFGDHDAVKSVLLNVWIVQAVLVTAVVSLIYRLQSDLAVIANLDSVQRASLDEFVAKKSSRLWLLFFMIAVSALLPRIMDVFPLKVSNVLINLSIIISIATALYCFYLPAMWNELRRFLATAARRNEARDEQEKMLAKLTGKTS